MKSSAGVYLWQGLWRVHPEYVGGADSIASLPVTCLAEDVDDLTLGQAIRAALAASAQIRTEPSERVVAAVLKELGDGSWRTLELEALLVLVYSTGGSIRILPMHAFADPVEREYGWRGEHSTRLPMTVGDADLGRAVRDGAVASSQHTHERPVVERELARMRFWSRVDLVLYCLLAVAVVAVLVTVWRLRS